MTFQDADGTIITGVENADILWKAHFEIITNREEDRCQEKRHEQSEIAAGEAIGDTSQR